MALWCSDERVVVEVHDQGRKARVEEVPFVEVMVAYVDEDRHGEPPTDSRSLPWWQVVGSLVVDVLFTGEACGMKRVEREQGCRDPWRSPRMRMCSSS